MFGMGHEKVVIRALRLVHRDISRIIPTSQRPASIRLNILSVVVQKKDALPWDPGKTKRLAATKIGPRGSQQFLPTFNAIQTREPCIRPWLLSETCTQPNLLRWFRIAETIFLNLQTVSIFTTIVPRRTAILEEAWAKMAHRNI